MYNKNCEECEGEGIIYLSDDVYDNCSCKYHIISKWKILFGKYKGNCFKDIPQDYLKWCYNKKLFLPRNKRIHDYISYIINTCESEIN